MIDEPGIIEFRSRTHPAFKSRAQVFSARMALPLGISMLPVMILGLSSALQGFSVLAYLYVGFPAAIMLSAAWTYVQIRDVLVELHFRDTDVGVRSLISAASPASGIKWYRLLDLKTDGESVRLTLGHSFYHIRPDEWPDRQNLKHHLLSAAGGVTEGRDD